MKRGSPRLNEELSIPEQAMNKSSESALRPEQLLETWALPKELAAEIEQRCTFVTYEERATILRCGASADLVFLVFKGLIRVYIPLANGSRILIFIARPGEPLGIIDRVDENGRRQHAVEAEALTKCVAGLLSRQHLAEMLRKLKPDAAIKLLENLHATWSAAFERLARFLGLSFRERLEFVLADLVARFGVEEERGVLIVPELSQEDLAEMIGSSRPMVSKIIADMTEARLLVRHDRHLILRRNAAYGQSRRLRSRSRMSG